ncbi:MAG TPA: nucleoside triphosphate pyrophosphohydrolase [Vicinamibacterales bacterium]
MTRPRRRRPPAGTPRQSGTARRAAAAFARLVRVMQTLRSPGGCPWDREQTHASLRPHLLEEAYEAIETIDRGDLDALRAELGDVLFQCVFHAQIAAEDRRFDIGDAVDAITQKLIRRHPHVFTPSGRPLSSKARRTSLIRTSTAVKEQWEVIKAREQASAGTARRVLKGVPRSLPALQRAHEIGRRVAAVGFDWAHASDVVDKMDEEVRELRAALSESPERAAEELGDFLFSVANLARKLGVEPESALRTANDKFTRRFDALEEWFERRGRSVHGASLEELEAGWSNIKGRG